MYMRGEGEQKNMTQEGGERRCEKAARRGRVAGSGFKSMETITELQLELVTSSSFIFSLCVHFWPRVDGEVCAEMQT